ncbi:MAG TPA: L-histidine N(alpha)-methyltransferase [Acidobacteriaceae bacterium]|jgi:L-histidine N-alpha-methyltransferase|nr:L-histidine N(alpha)-methyltransferase [Acidobacteriaceae bacterium]
MSTLAAPLTERISVAPAPAASLSLVARAALRGLTATDQRTLPPWLFYDAIGSALFERITELPEYYLTRTERAIFTEHADAIIAEAAGEEILSIAELGAGTAAKTGLLLASAVRRQGNVFYRPVDVSPTALEMAKRHLETSVPGVLVEPQLADYAREPILLDTAAARRLVLYIGSSIGNFSPEDAVRVLRTVREQLLPGDTLLLGVDMVKDEPALLAAYDDAAGITAEFNRNMLHRLNRELGADFDVARFSHRAHWNAAESRMEMHLVSNGPQRVTIDDLELNFAAGETIHTENSYKFTQRSIAWLLKQSGFTLGQQWTDEKDWFAVNLAVAS